MNRRPCTLDFESRSACDLRKTGSWKYSLDPSTQVLCLAFRLPHWKSGRTALWHPAFPHLGIDEAICPELGDLFAWIVDGGLVEAHNAWFERGIWVNIMVPRYDWVPVPHTQWRCSAAKAAAHALPRALEDAVKALGLRVKKDLVGQKLMKKLSKPRKPRKAEIDQWLLDGAPHLWWESRKMFEGLWAYCRQDVLAEEALSQYVPDLPDSEVALYLLDQQINETGVRLDQSAITTALRLIAEETVDLNTEISVLTEGFVQQVTQRQRLLIWLEAEGLHLDNTQKQTIEELLEGRGGEWSYGDLTPRTTRALEILRELGKSSTAKYEKMRDWVCPDGRMHGSLLYHGASTGRWSGAGVQPHNFPKGTYKDWDMTDAWVYLQYSSRAQLREYWGSVMAPLSQALRGVIVPAEGQTLYVADYAAIEARVLLWLAEDEEALDVYREGRDMYVEMASAIYGREITKADKHERQLGKVAVLGCFGPDTLVLTDRGWTPITDIQRTDRLWDGVEWVSHEGVVAQGPKETCTWLGLQVTPDHQIWTGNSWCPVALLAHPEYTHYLQSALASVRSLLLGSLTEHEAAFVQLLFSAIAGGPPRCVSRIFGQDVPPDVMRAPRMPAERHDLDTMASRRYALMQSTGVDYWTASAPSSLGAMLSEVTATKITEAEVLRSSGPTLVRDDRTFFDILCRFPGGMIPTWKSTEPTTTGTTHPTTSGLPPEVNKTQISDTWDVANVGPRNRYAVLTSQGPLIVHNCGYQMGAGKFVATAATYGITIEEDFAADVVETYRTKFSTVKQLWGDQEAAAIAATERPGTAITCGRIVWQKRRNFLYAKLPSGRELTYPFPQVKTIRTPWGSFRPQLSFMGVSAFNHQWQRQHTYGGMIVENLVQAISRDIMARAMQTLAESGIYQPILTVHDELVAEADPLVGSVEDFVALVTRLPDWAVGCPIDADGHSGLRYKK